MSEKTPLQSLLPLTRAYSEALQPYIQLARLHRFPTGTLLMVLPSVWGLTMAAHRVHPPVSIYLKAVVGHFAYNVMLHSAVCTLNDICDRHLDAQVERTKNRPLVKGSATVFGAWVSTIIHTLISLGILAVLTDKTTFILSLFGIFPLHALYPLMKRWTYWPQAWLGLTMNWGIIVTWLSFANHDLQLDIPLVTLFGTFCWTIVYDTIYGCQDKRDDAKIGIKSTSLLFESRVSFILSVFAIGFVVSLAYVGIRNGHGPVFFLVSVLGSALHLVWQLRTLDPESPFDCSAKFKANHTLGYIVTIGLVADCVIRL